METFWFAYNSSHNSDFWLLLDSDSVANENQNLGPRICRTDSGFRLRVDEMLTRVKKENM